MMESEYHPDHKALRFHGATQAGLHERALAVAQKKFGRKVFVRGVVEASNFCRENCHYCGMRRDNRNLDRFRARHDELAELLIHHRPASITDINIQTGEDLVAAREVVLPLIQTLRRETNLGISICLGSLTIPLYADLRTAGASVYIMKFELANPASYERLEAPKNLAVRLQHIRHLAETGWHVSSGFIAGLPEQSDDDLLANLSLAQKLPLAGCSVSPFIPGEATPLANAVMGDIDLTLNCMALLRLMRPDWVIPAVSALNLAEPGDGYRRGLRTGANLVTINLTPDGARDNYLLYKRDRFIMTEERILNAIAAEHLEPSGQSLADHFATKPHSGKSPIRPIAADALA